MTSCANVPEEITHSFIPTPTVSHCDGHVARLLITRSKH